MSFRNGASQSLPCDGNETLVQDIDACAWAGNVGWVLIALGKLQRSGFYDNPTALRDALDRGAAWVVRQLGRDPAYPNLISHGIEGNISAYFGLLAAGKTEAPLLGNAIFQFGWDPVQHRLKPGVESTGDATGDCSNDTEFFWG